MKFVVNYSSIAKYMFIRAVKLLIKIFCSKKIKKIKQKCNVLVAMIKNEPMQANERSKNRKMWLEFLFYLEY